jgi:hypothetical protein
MFIIRAEVVLAANAMRAASFLGAVHSPCPGWNDREVWDLICYPLRRPFLSTNTSIARSYLTLDEQRHVACTKDDSHLR